MLTFSQGPWQTGEWMWLILAFVLVILTCILPVFAWRSPTTDKKSDILAVLGFVIVYWSVAALCILFGALQI